MDFSNDFLSNLKIRGSWGTLGNQGIGPYDYIQKMGTYKIGEIIGGTRPVAVSPPQLVAQNFTWETVTTKNLGVDIGLLANKLTAEFDYYVRDDFEIHPFQWEPHNGLSYTFNTIYELRNTYYMHLNAESKAISIPFIIPEDDQKTLLHGYYASTSFIDAQVGRLLDALEAAEIAEDTIIVFWGDHGFHLGDHNEWGKHTNMEQATRSPLIISVPNFGAKGRKTMTPVTFLDIYPTLCELAGLPIPEQPLSNTQLTGRPLRGKSLVPVLADPNSSVRFGATIHYGTFYYGYAY